MVYPSDGPNGCALVITKDILPVILSVQSPIESVAAVLSIDSTFYTVCSMYLSPSRSYSQALLEDYLRQVLALSPPGSRLLLLGDFNARHLLWGDSLSNRRGHLVAQFLLDNGLSPLNTDSPTHITIRQLTISYSHLDLSLVPSSAALDYQWATLSDPRGSDHFPISISFPAPLIPPHSSRWSFRRADWSLFTSLLPFSLPVAEFSSIDDMASHFVDGLQLAAGGSIPRTRNVSRPPVPWWTLECTNAVKARRAAFRRFRRTRSPIDWIVYKRRVAKARYTLKQANRASWCDYVSSLSNTSSSAQVWRKVRRIAGNSSHTPSPLLRVQGALVADPFQTANILGSTLARLTDGSRYLPDFQLYKAAREADPCDFTSTNSEDYNVPFTLDELYGALRDCQQSAPRPDEVTYGMLQHLSLAGFHFLLALYNRIWLASHLPSGWHDATILPFPKPGKDASSPDNYRPISLTCCTCKLLERMVNRRLVWYLETHNVLSPYQFGFRKGRTTTDSLIMLERSIRESFNSGHHQIAIFFDIEKAYDTTWQYGILLELHAAGLRGRLPLFVRDFLSDRRFRIRVGGTLSDWYRQVEGVPQGSILSVTCFLLAMNSVSQCLQSPTRHFLYVDDLTISISSSRLSTIQRLLQLAIDAIVA